MFKAIVILSPRGKPHHELKIQSRNLLDVTDSLSPEAVLVRTQVAGVCHSDLHLWQGYYKVASK